MFDIRKKRHWFYLTFYLITGLLISSYSLTGTNNYSCGLSTATIEYSCPSVCVSV